MTDTDIPTRDELIELCIRGSVPQDRWRDRDSAGAQRQLGECLALLAAGCDFTCGRRNDDRTWWVDIWFKGFDFFEWGSDKGFDSDHFYVPTDKRLTENAGKDWY